MKKDFDEFYQVQWSERWDILKTALLQPNRYIARVNSWSDPLHWPQQANPSDVFLSTPLHAIQLHTKQTPLRDAQGLLNFYPMDAASLFPVLALELEKNDHILDMCAAPGGKSLLILELTKNPEHVVLNELSTPRRKRLRQVLQDYLPQEISTQINVTSWDARRIGIFQKQHYEKILLDAPCSGERHLLQNPNELEKWSKNRSRNLARRQYALLASAWQALKPGGRIVYSTCSISNLENDLLMEKFNKKHLGNITWIKKKWKIGEATKWGWQILPDHANQWGPIYFACLEKSMGHSNE